MDDILYKKKYLKYKIKYHNLNILKGGTQDPVKKYAKSAGKVISDTTKYISGYTTGRTIWNTHFKSYFENNIKKYSDFTKITKLAEITSNYNFNYENGIQINEDDINTAVVDKGNLLFDDSEYTNLNHNYYRSILNFLYKLVDYINLIYKFINDTNTLLECMSYKIHSLQNITSVSVINGIMLPKTMIADRAANRKINCKDYNDISDKQYDNKSILEAKIYLYDNTLTIFKELYDMIIKLFYVKSADCNFFDKAGADTPFYKRSLSTAKNDDTKDGILGTGGAASADSADSAASSDASDASADDASADGASTTALVDLPVVTSSTQDLRDNKDDKFPKKDIIINFTNIILKNIVKFIHSNGTFASKITLQVKKIKTKIKCTPKLLEYS